MNLGNVRANLQATADRLYLFGYSLLFLHVVVETVFPSSTVEKIKNLCPTISPFKILEQEEILKLSQECQGLYRSHVYQKAYETNMRYATLFLGLCLFFRLYTRVQTPPISMERARSFLTKFSFLSDHPIKTAFGGLLLYKFGANALGAFQTSRKIHEACPGIITLSQIATASRSCQELYVQHYSSCFYTMVFGGLLTLLTMHLFIRCYGQNRHPRQA